MMKSDGILTEFLARTTLVILLIIRGALLAARQMLYVFITKQTSIKAYYYIASIASATNQFSVGQTEVIFENVNTLMGYLF